MAKKTTTRKRAKVIPFKVPSPRLSRYLYVEVRAWFDPFYQPKPNEPVRQEDVFGGEPISCHSLQVRAKSLEQAYQLGAALMYTQRTEEPTMSDNHFTGQFLNDYAVKL